MNAMSLLLEGNLREIEDYFKKNKELFIEETTFFTLKGTKFEKHQGKKFVVDSSNCGVFDLIVDNSNVNERESIFDFLYKIYSEIDTLDLKTLCIEQDIAYFLINHNYTESFKKFIEKNPESLSLNALLNSIYELSDEDYEILLKKDVKQYKNCFLNCMEGMESIHLIRLFNVISMQNDEAITGRIKRFYSHRDFLRTLIKNFDSSTLEKEFDVLNIIFDFKRLKGLAPAEFLQHESNRTNLTKVLFNKNQIGFINKLMSIDPTFVEDVGIDSIDKVKEKIELKSKKLRKEVSKEDIDKFLMLSHFYYEKKELTKILSDKSSLSSNVNKKRI